MQIAGYQCFKGIFNSACQDSVREEVYQFFKVIQGMQLYYINDFPKAKGAASTNFTTPTTPVPTTITVA